MQAEKSLTSLSCIRKAHYKGIDGLPGDVRARNGKDAGRTYIKVPMGTSVYEVLTTLEKKAMHRESNAAEVFIGEVLHHKQEMVICRGGTGGKGNFEVKNLVEKEDKMFGSQGQEKVLVMF